MHLESLLSRGAALGCGARVLAILAALGFCLTAAGSANAAPANFAGASADGAVVLFATTEKLVPGDTDSKLDVYERSYDTALESRITRAVSTGPTGGNDAFDAFYAGVAVDGELVFFSTSESLVAVDGDRAEDIYMRDLSTGTTTLVSAGASACAPSCGNGIDAAIYFDAAPDGSQVYFTSTERLVPGDADMATDVYRRDLLAGTTALISQGAVSCAPGCGNGAVEALFQGASAAGEEVVFSTNEQLAAADTDSLGDLYLRDLVSGTTGLVSTSGACPPATDCTPAFGAISGDGSRVFFETNERLGGGDSDNSSDLYEWQSGAVTLLSTGPVGGNGPANATYEADASGGADVYFQTSEKLVSGDGDSATDVYERSGGVTSLVSTGPAGGDGDFAATLDKVSPDGTTVLFSTAEPLVAEDLDAKTDVYSRSGITTTLVSLGPGTGDGGFAAAYAGASADASQAYFETAEPLLAQDGDTRPDIYARAAATTTLVSTGPVGHDGPHNPNLSDVSADGDQAVFITEERMTEGDLDTERDVYAFAAAGTLLVSTGNSVLLGPPTPALTGTNPLSPNPSLTPAVLGQAESGTAIKLYATIDCSGAPVGTGTAFELATTGVRVAVEASSTSIFRATATDSNGDTSACSSSSVTYRQEDAAPPAEEGGGDQGGGGASGGSGAGGGSSTGGTSPGTSQKVPGGKDGGRSDKGALAPQTKVTFAPLFKTRARRPVIGFVDQTGQEGTTFSCRVDRRAWASCSSPYRIKRLALGRHVFRVKGVNSGLSEPRPVVRKFKVVAR
jgi:hypothetical protein